MTKFTGLAHIGLYTSDIEQSKAFYCGNFDFSVLRERVIEKENGDQVKVSMIGLGEMLIELIEHSDARQQKSGNDGCVDHIAIQVDGLLEIIEALKLKGYNFFTEEPVQIQEAGWESHYIYLHGPSMESIELMEYL